MTTALSNGLSPPIASPTPSFAQAGTELRRMESPSSVTSLVKQKMALSGIGAPAFLKKLGKDIATLGKGFPSAAASPSMPNELPTPPQSPSPHQRGPPYVAGHAELLNVVAEGEEDELELHSSSTPPDLDNPADPDYLAHRIQELIDNLPPASSPAPRRPIPLPRSSPKPRSIPLPPESAPQKTDRNGKPIPPPGAVPMPIEDSKLLAFLQSATIMNGGKDVGKPTVWDMLQRLGAPPHWLPGQGDGGGQQGGDSGGRRDGENDGDDSALSDESSVMMYSPLIPTKADIVELAEVVPIYIEEEMPAGEGDVGAEMPTVPLSRWMTVWPMGGWFSAYQEQEQAMEIAASAPVIVVSPPPPCPSELPRSPRLGEGGKKYRVRSQRAWVPSADKVSYEVMWWGYRVYLPPPAMLVLNDKTIEAQKRASLITSAFTWFFNNIPVEVLPLPFQPTVMLLQRLAPYLGYIGTFIAWSWNTVKRYDLGHGVILSATWLLPIALVPGTWFENQFPKSPSLPTEDLPASPSLPAPRTPGTPTETTPSTPAPTTPSAPRSPSVPSSPGLLEESDSGSGPISPPTSPESYPSFPPETYPTPSIPLPPEDEGETELPWDPAIGVSFPSHSPRSIRGGGGMDKRGWGRFQVLRGAPKALFEQQSYAVMPATFYIAPSSTASSSSPSSPAAREYSVPASPYGGSSSPMSGSAWGTPMKSPRGLVVDVGAAFASQSSVVEDTDADDALSIMPEVQLGSPLMEELLMSRRVGTVPLPSDVEDLFI